jgi:hypothetical protein
VRVEDFKKTVEERKTYVETKIAHLKEKLNYKFWLMFDNECAEYTALMAKNKGKDFYKDTKQGQELDKLANALHNRENELDAINAYLEVINQNKDDE